MAENKNYFADLNGINVSDKIESKGDNGQIYLSWAWAWGELKKKYPLSYYTIYESPQGWNYFTDSKTAWVKTGVTVVFADGTSLEHIEYLPIMNSRNRSLTLDEITSFEVNKTIQRSITKACARHGIGLYIYAGEELTDEEREQKREEDRKSNNEKAIKLAEIFRVGLGCINAVREPEDAAKALETINGLEDVDGSTKKLKVMLNERLAKVGIVFDTVTKTFMNDVKEKNNGK